MIPPDELKIEAIGPIQRARAAGGQSVNITDHGVRMTHKPTGIVAECELGRSQPINREVCEDMILTALTHPKLKLP